MNREELAIQRMADDDRLMALLAARQRPSMWLPIETAPKLKRPILVGLYMDGAWIAEVASYGTSECHDDEYQDWFTSGDDCNTWTHWMPLPPPPCAVQSPPERG